MPLDEIKNELIAVLVAPNRCSAREQADAIDALIKERITQAILGCTESAPAESREALHINILKAWGDAT